jgi:hypothetical protein
MSAHDEIISSMLEVLNPPRGEIRLLGRVNDPLLSNPSEKEVFFFIPDLHLISPERQRRFGKYGFNYQDERLLLQLLQKLAELGESWTISGNNKLITIQLGDFYDMWREFSGIADPGAVKDDSNGELRDILYRGRYRGKPCLKSTMILGNHDTRNGIPLQEVGSQLKAFNRTDDDRPFLFMTHGDAFDILEITVPEPIKEFAVYFVGDQTPVNKYPIGNWGKTSGKINKTLGDLDAAITMPEHLLSQPGYAPKVLPGQLLPDTFCHEISSLDEADNRFFKKMYESIDIAKENNMPGQYVRIIAMGHTHHASMILCRPADNSRPMVLMDVGAWIEKCQYSLADDGGTVTEPSAQLGVICGNDARIYQIRLPV